MPYYVSSEAQRLLLHAGTHALLHDGQAADVVADLPPLGRILLKVRMIDAGRQASTLCTLSFSPAGLDQVVYCCQ